MTAFPRHSYSFGAFRLDRDQKLLFQDGRPVALTPKAIDTLLALVERHGRLVTKEELIRIVWPDAFVEENNLAQNISLLRRVLGEGAERRQYIETIPRRGYRFVGPVSEEFDRGGDVASAREGTATAAVAAPAGTPPVEGNSAAHTRTRRTAAPWRVTAWGLMAAAAVSAVVLAVGGSRSHDRTARTPGQGSAAADAPARTGVTRIAVLPFVNLGPADDEYFVAGFTEEVTSRLATVGRLAVTSSTTMSGYDRREKTLRQIGADLGVEYLVEGSVRWARASNAVHVRITPKLIRVSDDAAVWTGQYESSLSDLFKVQAEIAYRITGALQVVLGARERRAVEARPTADGEAYLAYLRGMAAYQQGASDTGNQAKARADLESAVARDSRFALAWSWLARVYASQYTTGAGRTPQIRQAAQRAAETAIALDPALPEGHLGLAQVLMIERDYEGARRELEIARAGLPNSPELLRMIGTVEQRMGRWSESLRVYTRAFDLDPASIADAIALHYLHMRQYADARRFIDIARAANRVAAVVPDAWLRFSESGDVAAARGVLEPVLDLRSPADSRVIGLLSRLEWFAGREQRALELIGRMDPAGAWLPPNFRYPASLAAGHVYDGLGRREEALRHYAAALEELERRQRAAPDDYQVEAAMGIAAAGLGRAVEAVRHGERAVELLPVTRDAAEGPLYLYVLAQIHARLARHTAAFATLDRMFSVPGFYNETWVQRDPGFAGLRNDPAFRAHVDRWSSQKGDVLLAPSGPQ